VIPLEEEINGVEGMTYMASTANDGSANISVYFGLGTDPDIAAVNVQNRVARATSKLPSSVVQTGVTDKSQNSALMFFALYSNNKDYDEVYIQNYAKINLVPKLQRVKG
jgi:HAE1 family hydrophobic/amphiphilic exporter-1